MKTSRITESKSRIIPNPLKATPDDVRNLEFVLGSPLPEPYRQFLHRNNGGIPASSIFVSFREKPEHRIQIEKFLSATGSGPDSILGARRLQKGWIPKGLMPIATTSAGGLICLGVSFEVCGKVLYWDRELPGQDGDPPASGSAILVADRFDDFSDMLTSG